VLNTLLFFVMSVCASYAGEIVHEPFHVKVRQADGRVKVYNDRLCTEKFVDTSVLYTVTQVEYAGAEVDGYHIAELNSWVRAGDFVPVTASSSLKKTEDAVPGALREIGQQSSAEPTLVRESLPATLPSPPDVPVESWSVLPSPSPEGQSTLRTSGAVMARQAPPLPAEPLFPAPPQRAVGSAREAKNDSPKDHQLAYNQDNQGYRAQVERAAWQRAEPDKRNFAAFARNYSNRIHCDGVISDVLFPVDKGLEIKILNDGHDVFLRVGQSVPPSYAHFPVDLTVLCNGQVYQFNAVIDAKYPGTNVDLVGATNSAREIKQYSEAIQRAAALPHEDKISRIMQRVYQDKPLPYWHQTSKSQKFTENGYAYFLRQTIKTNIEGIVAWDFSLDNSHLTISELLHILKPAVAGEIISIGRVQYSNAQRVVVLSVVGDGGRS